MGFYPPRYSNEYNIASADILSEYKALGPFYPNIDYALRMVLGNEFRPEELAKISNIPSAVQIKFHNSGQTLTQLYVQGPALIRNGISPASAQIQGTFCDRPNYNFKTANANQSISKEEMGAVVTKPIDYKSMRGGVAVWSTHPEASTKNSKMLQFFQKDQDNERFNFFRKKGERNDISLSQKSVSELEKHSEATVEQFATCIRETFKIT